MRLIIRGISLLSCLALTRATTTILPLDKDSQDDLPSLPMVPVAMPSATTTEFSDLKPLIVGGENADPDVDHSWAVALVTQHQVRKSMRMGRRRRGNSTVP